MVRNSGLWFAPFSLHTGGVELSGAAGVQLFIRIVPSGLTVKSVEVELSNCPASVKVRLAVNGVVPGPLS